MFMGTPHRGTELASFGQMVANMARVAFKKPSLQLLEVLEHDSQALQDLLEDTSTILSSIPVISCFEQKETKLSKGIFSKTTLVSPIVHHYKRLSVSSTGSARIAGYRCEIHTNLWYY